MIINDFLMIYINPLLSNVIQNPHFLIVVLKNYV